MALIALLASCGRAIHTGISGDLAGTKAATTSLAVPAGAVEVRLTGRVNLLAGTATVTLTPPSGPAKTFTSTHSLAAGGEEGFEIGPYSASAVSGLYGLSVAGGDASASGSYDLDLEAW
jgi:hypothetical protein